MWTFVTYALIFSALAITLVGGWVAQIARGQQALGEHDIARNMRQTALLCLALALGLLCLALLCMNVGGIR